MLIFTSTEKQLYFNFISSLKTESTAQTFLVWDKCAGYMQDVFLERRNISIFLLSEPKSMSETLASPLGYLRWGSKI